MQGSWRRQRHEIRYPVFELQRIASGKRDDRRSAAFRGHKARTERRKTVTDLVVAHGEVPHAPVVKDLSDLVFVCRLIGELRHPHHGSGIVYAEPRGRRETVHVVLAIGTFTELDQEAHRTIPSVATTTGSTRNCRSPAARTAPRGSPGTGPPTTGQT